MSEQKLIRHIQLVNELEVFSNAATKLSSDFRTFRALAFCDADDDKRLTDIQMLINTVGDMLLIESKILFHKLTEDGKKIQKTVKHFEDIENSSCSGLVDEEGELKNW